MNGNSIGRKRSKVALIIPVHNRRETTLQGLRSLKKANTEGLDVKIYIVDDGSTDGTSEAVNGEFPEIELILGDGSLHYAAGTNRGIEAALKWEPDHIVTMNDDSVFHEDFLQRLLSTSHKFGDAIVGSLLLLWDEPHRVFQVGQKWSTLRGGWVIPQDLTAFSVGYEPFEVECIVGNCVLFPVRAIRENGLMDEKKFPHGWGDAQYLMRMRKAGWKLMVDPRSLVWCEPNTYPRSLHSLGLKQMAAALFSNERHPANLKRQFVARWESAPTKLQGLGGYIFYCTSLAFKSIKFGIDRIVGKLIPRN